MHILIKDKLTGRLVKASDAILEANQGNGFLRQYNHYFDDTDEYGWGYILSRDGFGDDDVDNSFTEMQTILYHTQVVGELILFSQSKIFGIEVENDEDAVLLMMSY